MWVAARKTNACARACWRFHELAASARKSAGDRLQRMILENIPQGAELDERETLLLEAAAPPSAVRGALRATTPGRRGRRPSLALLDPERGAARLRRPRTGAMAYSRSPRLQELRIGESQARAT